MALLKCNTRFEPTVNGPLHVGHLYLILVNEAEAHNSGGKFVVRYEDNQPEWTWQISPERAAQFKDETKADLDWIGVHVDEYLSQSEMEPTYQCLLAALNEFRGYNILATKRFAFDQQPELTYSPITPYPYAPYLTMERVVYDYLAGINLLIRGEDLLSEFGLYAYFCDVFGIQRPRMVYVPRMKIQGGGELLSIGVSKTIGKAKICDYRQSGMDPETLRMMLAAVCLKDPDEPWLLTNLVKEPLWTY